MPPSHAYSYTRTSDINVQIFIYSPLVVPHGIVCSLRRIYKNSKNISWSHPSIWIEEQNYNCMDTLVLCTVCQKNLCTEEKKMLNVIFIQEFQQ